MSNRTSDSPNGNGNGDCGVALLEEPQGAVHAAGVPIEKPARKSFFRRPLAWVLLTVVFAGAAIGIVLYLHALHFESTDDAYIDGRVIPISPQVAAEVAEVRVDDNQVVHKGDLLVRLNDTDYRVAREQAMGAQASATGKLEQAKAQIGAAQAAREAAAAALNLAQANADNADQDLKRYESLDARARSKQVMDNAIAAQKTALAQVEQAKANVASAQAQIATARAAVAAAAGDVAKASADVSRAQVNLRYCSIVAPEEGRVTRKNVEPGAYVTSAQPLLAIVPADVWVTANFKETQLNNIHPGQRVAITIDAYSGQEFTGKVESIQAGTGSRFSVLPAENATGNFVKVVQRVPVKIVFDKGQTDSPDRVLAPGMSVQPKITIR